MKRLIILVVFISFLLSACESDTSGLTGASTSEVIDLPGKNTSGVVLITLNGGACTGILVTPFHVLTAAHCILETGVTSPTQIRVFNAPDFEDVAHVVNYITHPDYVYPSYCNGPDVAILHLCGSLPVYRWDGSLWEDFRRPISKKGTSYTFPVGVLYGLASGYRYSSVLINTLPATADSGYHATFTPDYVSVQGGDSGGPLFYTNKIVGSGKLAPHYVPGQSGSEEDWEIIGIAACGGGGGSLIQYTASSTFKSWADNIIQNDSEIDCKPTNPELTSATHSIGQPSCKRILTVDWTTPTAIRGVGGYSYTLVEQNDPDYETNRTPNDVINLNRNVTSFTTENLEPGIWEFNLRTIDAGGLAADFYSSYWIETVRCTVNITSPSGGTYEVGEWINVFWDPIIFGGDDVSGGYIVDSIDLLNGPIPVSNLVSNLANIGSSGFIIPEVDPGYYYQIRIILKRNSYGDMFPELPETIGGVSEYITIIPREPE